MPLVPASSRTPSSGGAASTLVGRVSLGAPAATMDVSTGFPGSYFDLQVFIVCRVTTAAATDVANLTFNGDNAALHYNVSTLTSINSLVAGAVSVNNNLFGVNVLAATATPNAASAIAFWIPGAGLSTFFKTFYWAEGYESNAVASGQSLDTRMGLWQSTAIISEVTMSAPGGQNFVAGSVMSVYAYS